jgi:hypothetical protein
MLKPSATAVAAGDGRSWMGLSATLGNASLVGVEGADPVAHRRHRATINRGSGVKTTGTSRRAP